MKRLTRLLVLVLSIALAFSALISCSADAASTTGVSPVSAISSNYHDEDLDATYDAVSATKITLQGNNAAVSGTGASVDGTIVTVDTAGTYVITGSLYDGQIRIDADKDAMVHLVLSGMVVTSSDGPSIYCKQAEKVIVTLADNTNNRLTDERVYNLEDSTSELNATLYSQDDLSFNGTGTLIVQGDYGNGIVSRDDLVIVSGTYAITAAGHGLQGRDSLTVKDGSFTITAGGDGLQSNNSMDEAKGWVVIDGGTFEISADDDGIHAETALDINGGTITVTESYEGLEGKTVTITNGLVDLTSSDDGINAADASGNTMPAMAPGNTTGNAAPTAPGSVPSTDGSQAAPPDAAMNSGTAVDGDICIRISGGTVRVNANGDGLDANGNLFIEGGTVLVCGPTENGNGPMDYDGVCTVSGGTLAIAGSAGMAQSPGTSSTQPSLTVIYRTVQPGGTTATLTDSNGNILLSFTPSKDYQSLVFSSDKLVQGETYTLYTGGVENSEAGDFTNHGTLEKGTRLSEVTISSVVTRLADDGSTAAASMGMHGPGGRDGRQKPPGFDAPTEQ